MATTAAQVIAIARMHLNEASAIASGAWTDAELAALGNLACHDLWRAINDNFQDYFLTISTAVSQAASAGATTLTGVPSDVAIVRGLEPSNLSSRPGLVYEARNYTHIDFARARSQAAIDPSQGGKIFYHLQGAGAPIAAPTINVAPGVNAAVTLRLTYVPTLDKLVASAPAAGETITNPIPGESDNAIIAWIVGYAMAKIAEDQAPNAGWLALYGTEKQNMLVSLTPRQTDDDDVAEAMFEDQWQ